MPEHCGFQEDEVLLFGEVVVRDEYNPLQPNDYEAEKKKRDAEKRRTWQLQKQRDQEDTDK